MNDLHVSQLIKCALMETASSMNEKFAALSAEISLENGIAWVNIDHELWDDLQKAKDACAIIEKLSVEIVFEATLGTFVSIFPKIGRGTNRLDQYVDQVATFTNDDKNVST